MKLTRPIKHRTAIILIVLISSFIAIFDFSTGPQLNEEFLYIIPILLTLWIHGKKSTIATSALVIILSFSAYYYFSIRNNIWVFAFAKANRLYALVGILVTTYVVLQNKEKEKIIQANIEELNKLVEELKISNTDLEQYAYIASHDLQEPLRTITNYIGLLEKRIEPCADDHATDFLKRIESSAERMRTLVRDVLSYSLVGKKRIIEAADCNLVLNNVLRDMAFFIKENQATIIADQLPVIWSCKDEMKQLFQNLVNNAVKYKKADVLPEIHVRFKDRGSAWEFSVEDNGIGIEEEYYVKIFEIFQRLHSKSAYQGTGIGLAICGKIIQMHKGKIWVESKPGVGSVFYFTIPKINSNRIGKAKAHLIESVQ